MTACAPRPEQFEDLGRRLRGVYDCRVEMGEDGALPARVHVVADVRRRSAVARDLRSAFYAVFGVMVPLPAFSVSAMPAPPPAAAAGAGRFRLAQLSYEAEGGEQRVRVVLRRDTDQATGVAEADSAEDPLRAAAAAALAALGVALPWLPDMAVEEAGCVPAGDRQAVLVSVRIVGHAGESALRLGTALLRDDPRESAARAALNAVNRLAAGRPPTRIPD